MPGVAEPTEQVTKRVRRPDPEPLETDDRIAVLIGMALWVIAFAVLVVFFRDDLRRHHAEWWLWSCWIGVAFGCYGLRFVTRRRRALGLDRPSKDDPGQE
jgi:hypothetical protein